MIWGQKESNTSRDHGMRLFVGNSMVKAEERLSGLLQELNPTTTKKSPGWWLLITSQMLHPVTEDQAGLLLTDYNKNMFLETNALLKTRDIFLIRGKIN